MQMFCEVLLFKTMCEDAWHGCAHSCLLNDCSSEQSTLHPQSDLSVGVGDGDE